MRRRRLPLLPALLAPTLLALTLCLPAFGAEPIVFGDARSLTLTLDPATGAVVRIAVGGEEVAAGAAADPAVDVCLDGRWAAADERQAARLLQHGIDPKTGELTVTRALGVWEVAETFRLEPQKRQVARRVALTFRGEKRGQLRGVRFFTMGVRARGDGFYALPRQYPPFRRAFSEIKEGGTRSSNVHLAPAVAQVAPDRTLLWAIDGRTDKTGVTVRERDGALDVVQECRALGWVNPGDRQEVGTAYLSVVGGGYQAALGALWSWMDALGMRVPADRPTWVQDAALYSFHPGGTIGSNFQDLGGFVPATRWLLPTLPALGVNSVWIMPVEDVTVYNPRDYYKFQAGLGTPEEFRALVGKAHAEKLSVLQDLVPHGGRDDFPRAKENPQWLVRDEQGNTLDYWCYDFAYPSWQEYIGKVADHYVRHYDVDGYRVDAVGGSRIPNWSPNIPYARASLSQTPGGLGMLQHIRGAVKALKPRQGAVLAEVEGAPYAAESDIVYDFTLCYTVLPDLRRTAPDAFVERLKTYLYEQQHTDPKGTLRLRHVESHDSLRSQGRYGVAPAQALFALTAWIDGVPLVYHGMEKGNGVAIRRTLDIRKQFPELRRGEALYQASDASPAGVFTCVRRDGNNLAVVAINFRPEPVKASIALSPSLGLRADGRYTVQDAAAETSRTATGRELARLSRSLAPYEATVLAIRPAATKPAAAVATPKPVPPTPAASQAVTVRETGDTVAVENGRYRLKLDRRSGLPVEMTDPTGAPLLGRGDLFVDMGRKPQGPMAIRSYKDGDTTVLEFSEAVPGGKLALAYRFDRSAGFTMTGECPPDMDRAGVVLPLTGATRWTVDGAEGRLDDWLRPRPQTRKATRSDGIYGRPQGTDILWEDRVCPLRPGGFGVEARRADGRGVAIALPDALAVRPEAMHLLDYYDGKEGLHLLAAWRVTGHRDAGASVPPARFSLRMSALSAGMPAPAAASVALPAGVRLSHTGLDHVVETAQYRVLLRRTGGAIRELWALKPRPRLVWRDADVYGDRGFSSENTRFGTIEDVESGVRTWTEDGALHLRFTGRLRGDYRFDLTRPSVRDYQEYVFTSGPSFRYTWGVRSQRANRGGDGFLSAVAQVPEGADFTMEKAGQVLSRGTTGTLPERQGETKRLIPPTAPDAVRFQDAQGPLLSITGIRTAGPSGLSNAFVHRTQAFLTWLDGTQETLVPDRWYQATAVFTPGAGTPAPVPETAWVEEGAASPAGLLDPSFEGGGNALSLVTGHGLRLSGEAEAGAWQAPVGGELTAQTARDGRVSAQVTGVPGEYRLWRQSIPIGAYPPGTRVRLSGWIRTQDVVRGEHTWMTGTLRIAAFGTTTTYLEAGNFTGTSDWQHVTKEVVIPEGATSLDVQVGLNGASGVCWIDDVRVERLPSP